MIDRRGSLPNRVSSGLSASTYSVRMGMSAPLSRPWLARRPVLWLRCEPGWIRITSPSSRLMRAISVSIWARNSSALAGVTFPFSRSLEQGLGLDGRQVGGGGGGMAVVGRGGPGLDEGLAAQAVAFQIALPAGDVLAADLGEALEGRGTALVLEVDDRVGAIGGDHVAPPAALADGLVVLQPILRALGGGQGLDVEAVEQGPGPEGLGGQRLH